MVRQFCFRMAALVVFTMLLVVSAASFSEAAFGAGDLCWTVKITQDDEGPVTMPGMLVKVHIKSLDTTTFVMTGVANVSGDNPFILTGTATKIGTKIYANLVATQDHKVNESGGLWRDMDIMRLTIDSDTLSGSIFGVGDSFDRTTRVFDPMYASGTLIPKACP